MTKNVYNDEVDTRHLHSFSSLVSTVLKLINKMNGYEIRTYQKYKDQRSPSLLLLPKDAF